MNFVYIMCHISSTPDAHIMSICDDAAVVTINSITRNLPTAAN